MPQYVFLFKGIVVRVAVEVVVLVVEQVVLREAGLPSRDRSTPCSARLSC